MMGPCMQGSGSSCSLPSQRAAHECVPHTALLPVLSCRSESVTVNNFFSSVDGQLELLAQAALDSMTSSVGVLHALRPRLGHFHQLLREPPEVGRG